MHLLDAELPAFLQRGGTLIVCGEGTVHTERLTVAQVNKLHQTAVFAVRTIGELQTVLTEALASPANLNIYGLGAFAHERGFHWIMCVLANYANLENYTVSLGGDIEGTQRWHTKK